MGKNISIAIALFTITNLCFGQLVTTIQNPTTLVQNVLLGDPGITVSNITFNGGPSAIGKFTAVNTNLGLDSGIVMTTGTILTNSNGPIGPNNSPDAGVDNNSAGYQLLTSIVGKQTYNASVLSFDFQTCSDSIEFRYVFGSEEYPEYVGSQFNDVFGFFISGPGFAGQQNIARLPNGSVVAINNVNSGNNTPAQGVPVTGPTNPQWFVYNGNGNNAPYNGSSFYIQYDGFTRVMTAKAKVQCNATYRLVLAIADVGDPVWDSGIFLEAKSFKANDPLKFSYILDQQPFPENNVVAEPCTDARIRIDRTNCASNLPLTINVQMQGSATNGVDYQTIPSTITIPAGALFTEFDLTPIYDNLQEGTENVVFKFTYQDNCGGNRDQELELFIRDIEDVTAVANGGTPTCPGDPVVLSTTVTGGAQPYTYLWSTGETTPTITVNPLTTTNYSVVVTDECVGQQTTANVTVTVPTFTPIQTTVTNDIVEICPFIEHTINASSTGGFGGFSYQWSQVEGPALGNQASQVVKPGATTSYQVIATDACGLKDTAIVNYTITSPPLVVELNPTQQICPGDSAQLVATVSGGYGQYYYSWVHSGETTASVWVNPHLTTSYTVIVSDECQTFTIQGSTNVVVIKPTANFHMISQVPFNNLQLQFENTSLNAATYQWDLGNSVFTNEVHPSTIYTDFGIFNVTLIAIDTNGCRDTITKAIQILEEFYIYVPNTFSPNGDEVNDHFGVESVNVFELKIKIFNRWGQLIFTADDYRFKWDGTYKGVPVQDGTYTYKIVYKSRYGHKEELEGHVNVIR